MRYYIEADNFSHTTEGDDPYDAVVNMYTERGFEEVSLDEQHMAVSIPTASTSLSSNVEVRGEDGSHTIVPVRAVG